jgi:multidrug transporter EmrE-like cation transporter
MSYLPLILFGVLLNAAAQLLLKTATNRIGHFTFSWDNALPVLQQAAVNPYIWLGLTAYAVSLVVWLLALSRVDVTVAYPMLSLGYVVVAIVGHFWLQEALTLERILGIVIIMLGVFLLTRTA